MDSKNIADDLLTLEQNNILKEKTFSENSFEKYSKHELFQQLSETKAYSIGIEEEKKALQNSVAELKNALEEQSKKLEKLEKDKSFLRDNIKKASANWFERKAKLSEGDQDSSERNDSESNDESDTEGKPKKREGASILITDEAIKLFSELKFKDEQLELSERRCAELNKRVKDYEKVIDDQEVIIHGLENQLDTYFNDNKKMSKQLADLNKLFLDLEAINEKQVTVTAPPQDVESSTDHLPTSEEFKEMSGSVTKTYIRLKELIYEKKSLVTEIERLQILNVELQNRVSHQETRLISVSDALQTTWLLVSNLKDEHAKIHTAETILRYELKEKREILHRLREELECSREQWHIIRQKNSETEQEWTILREELNERRRLRKFAEVNGSPMLTSEELEGAVGNTRVSENEFEPPVDLLVDMGIEYGVLEADDEESMTVVALIDGEDVHEDRLHNLEEQCCFLYQKLMGSTARALTLATRLTSLHQHYAMSDGDDDDDDDENEQYFDENEDDDINMESEVVSPDSESYDTAYVSEADGADSGSVVADTNGVSNVNETEITNEDSTDLNDESCDLLSRRLITFLPRKIEILRDENKKLEERLQLQQEEKAKIEERLNASIEFERRQRKQLEQQLSHLGKCVDELKLERNGKIAKVEEELRKKIEQVDIEEKEHIQLRDEFEALQEKYDERGELLKLTAAQLEQTVKQSEEKLKELEYEISILKCEILKNGQTLQSSDCQQAEQESVNVQLTENIDNGNEGARPKVQSTPYGYNRSEVDERRLDTFLPTQSQLKKLVILTNTCLRIPIYLNLDSILCWSFHVTPQELKFSISFDDFLYENHSSTSSDEIFYGNTSSQETDSSGEHRFSCSIYNAIQISRELLSPHCIGASNSEVVGRLFPKVPGQYCLIFQNSALQSQEVFLKFWIETSAKQVVED